MEPHAAYFSHPPSRAHVQPPSPEPLSPQRQLQNGLSMEVTRHMSESWRTSKESLGPGLTPRAVPGSCLPRLRLGGHFHCRGSPPMSSSSPELTSPLAPGGRPGRAPSLPWHFQELRLSSVITWGIMTAPLSDHCLPAGKGAEVCMPVVKGLLHACFLLPVSSQHLLIGLPFSQHIPNTCSSLWR